MGLGGPAAGARVDYVEVGELRLFVSSGEGPGRYSGSVLATCGPEKACCGSGGCDLEGRIWKQR